MGIGDWFESLFGSSENIEKARVKAVSKRKRSVWNIVGRLNELSIDNRLNEGAKQAASFLATELNSWHSEVQRPGGYWGSVKKSKNQKARIDLLKKPLKNALTVMEVLMTELETLGSGYSKPRADITRQWNAIMEEIADQFPKAGMSEKISFNKPRRGVAWIQ